MTSPKSHENPAIFLATPMQHQDSQDVEHSNTSRDTDVFIPTPTSPNSVPNEVWSILDRMDPHIRQLYFGDFGSSPDELRNGELLSDLILSWSRQNPLPELLEEDFEECDRFTGDYVSSMSSTAEKLLKMERNARQAFRNNKEKFPTALWHCCKRRCFTCIAIDLKNVALFEELNTIHSAAEEIHDEIRRSSSDPQTRRRGIGVSSIAFAALSRAERETRDGITPGTDRRRALRKFTNFVLEVLPFLYGKEDAPNGTKCPFKKLCTQAICSLLGVSRNFLYSRKQSPNREPTELEVNSVVDSAGIRLRQQRREGDRTGYPSISDLPHFECGCTQPCLSGMKLMWLKNEYKSFSACARALNPRRKENRYHLNVMYCPFSHSPINVCNKALSALYTVSPGHISAVRLALQQMCDDPAIDHREFLVEGVTGYRKHARHPMNRYPDRIREKIEKQLDMVLRADPSGANGFSVCRVYSPEINTKEKLRHVLAKALEEDDSVDDELSESTLQRMMDNYLEDRKCTIVFNQNDHNACPNCKTMNYAILEYYYAVKELEKEYEREFGELSGYDNVLTKQRAETLRMRLEAKRYQETETLRDLRVHLERDAAIRRTVKQWSDHFRKVEKQYLDLWRKGVDDGLGKWNGLPHHGIVTHQDDMTKVDLPHFVVNVSADITRWRFDINAHVSAVNDDCVVFSHEQGSGPKNSSSITEMIILDHLIRCRGEGIKVIVSDNAAVGKNWITTIALPQYMIDQGLAQIVFVVFLENNHGKWLADMLFGQLQTKKRRSTLLSVDDLLSEFEKINRKSGTVRGLAINPLSNVDFSAVFESLGYETKPPKDFGFVKRNIHFAAACKQDAKRNLPPSLKILLGPGLPEDEGMVRITSSPPTSKHQRSLPYEERHFDVPAARLTGNLFRIEKAGITNSNITGRTLDSGKPLAVQMDKPFSVGGNGVVSQNTVKRVGYNGIEFRKQNGYHELRQPSSKLVPQAWPRGLVNSFSPDNSGEPIYETESVKCAPENWLVRKPVSHFSHSERDWKARYPPRNLLNSKFGKGPRTEEPWVPTQTYSEPPFPIYEHSASKEAAQKIAEEKNDISKSLDTLDLLQTVFECMEDKDDRASSDLWLHRTATIPHLEAIRRYKNELQIFIERGKGEPNPPKTLRQVFKEDSLVKEQVRDRIQGIAKHSSVAEAKIVQMLFEEAENKPGGLCRFELLVAKDIERYSAELRIYKENLKEFDKSRGLFPVEEMC